jgi:hypothetical protein
MLGRCEGAVGPGAEVCDGRDNDCDGDEDEGNPGGGADCSTGRPGICAAGTRRCEDGSLTCVAKAQPSMEACNGQDDNCDGETDEGFLFSDPLTIPPLKIGADCRKGVGACLSTGKVACASPTMAACNAAPAAPVSELRGTPAPNGSYDWNCDGDATPEFPGTTYFFYTTSCDSQQTFHDACELFSPGACNNATGFTTWFTYSCTGDFGVCGQRVIRFRCQYNQLTARCAYQHIQADNEAAPSGFYIPTVNRCR